MECCEIKVESIAVPLARAGALVSRKKMEGGQRSRPATASKNNPHHQRSSGGRVGLRAFVFVAAGFSAFNALTNQISHNSPPLPAVLRCLFVLLSCRPGGPYVRPRRPSRFRLPLGSAAQD